MRDLSVIQIANWTRRTLRDWGVAATGSILYSLSYLADLTYAFAVIIGFPICVFKLDRGAKPEEVFGSYTGLLAVAGWGTLPFAMQLAIMTSSALVNSMLISGLSVAVLGLFVPAVKRLLGADVRVSRALSPALTHACLLPSHQDCHCD